MRWAAFNEFPSVSLVEREKNAEDIFWKYTDIGLGYTLLFNAWEKFAVYFNKNKKKRKWNIVRASSFSRVSSWRKCRHQTRNKQDLTFVKAFSENVGRARRLIKNYFVYKCKRWFGRDEIQFSGHQTYMSHLCLVFLSPGYRVLRPWIFRMEAYRPVLVGQS